MMCYWFRTNTNSFSWFHFTRSELKVTIFVIHKVVNVTKWWHKTLVNWWFTGKVLPLLHVCLNSLSAHYRTFSYLDWCNRSASLAAPLSWRDARCCCCCRRCCGWCCCCCCCCCCRLCIGQSSRRLSRSTSFRRRWRRSPSSWKRPKLEGAPAR